MGDCCYFCVFYSLLILSLTIGVFYGYALDLTLKHNPLVAEKSEKEKRK